LIGDPHHIAHITPLVALLAGILILIVPRLLSFIVAIYLIIVGLIGRITKFGLLVQRDVRRRKWRTTRYELVYFCSEHIENAEASRARVCLRVHDINSELHPLAVDVHSFDRAAFRDAIKVVRECSSCVISARQLHMPRRFDGHRLPPGSRSAVPLSHPVWHTISDG
jgi:Protein of unknown function (DUF3096)